MFEQIVEIVRIAVHLLVRIRYESLEGNALVAHEIDHIERIRFVGHIADAVQHAVKQRKLRENIGERRGDERRVFLNRIKIRARRADVRKTLARSRLPLQLLFGVLLQVLEAQRGLLHRLHGRYIAHARKHRRQMDQVSKQIFAEERNFGVADHHQIGENLGQFAVHQTPHDEREIGGEEIGLGNTARGSFARNRGNEDRTVAPIDVVLRDSAFFFEIVRRGNADHIEQHGEHILRQLRLFFSVRVENVDVGIQTAEIPAEDENAGPGSQNGEQRHVANVARGLELVLLVFCDRFGLDEERIDDDLEVENGFLLAKAEIVQIVETRQNRRLEQRAVQRFHTAVEKNLHTIAENHTIGHVDDESENFFETGGAKRVRIVVRNAQNGENDRPRNQIREFLRVEKGKRRNINEMIDERESDFSLVVEFIGALERHDDEDVQLEFEHQLGDFAIHAEIFDESQTGAVDIRVVNHHHFANGVELLVQVYLPNQLRVRFEFLSIKKKRIGSYRNHLIRDFHNAIET